jgi:hypothetical protein
MPPRQTVDPNDLSGPSNDPDFGGGLLIGPDGLPWLRDVDAPGRSIDETAFLTLGGNQLARAQAAGLPVAYIDGQAVVPADAPGVVGGLFTIQRESGFDRGLGIVLPGVIKVAFGAGLFSAFTAVAAAPAVSVADSVPAVVSPAGSFGAPPMFSAEAAAQDAIASFTATPAEVSGSLLGPPPGSFAGPPLFGSENVVYDATRSVFNLSAPFSAPFSINPSLPSVPGSPVSDVARALPTVKQVTDLVKAGASVLGLAAAVQKLDSKSGSPAGLDGPPIVPGGLVPAGIEPASWAGIVVGVLLIGGFGWWILKG